MTSSKVQRWTDLIVGLLRHRLGVTFTELADDVPAYALPKRPTERQKATVKRMFERDKAELLAFGLPIETIGAEDEIEKYRLRPSNFYLPYLSIIDHSGRGKTPRRVDRDGYHSVQSLTFSPDELTALGAALVRVQKLGDPLLAEHARSAARKLAFDLEDFGREGQDDVTVYAERVDAAVLAVLNEALLGRKHLTFTYHSMSGDSTSERTVEPFGLFFLNSHWYLAAREPGAGVVKNFRASRIESVSANRSRPQSADFSVPQDFDLRQHARSRHAWELGDADAIDAVVEFVAPTGAAWPSMQLGKQIPGLTARRAYRIKSVDRFVRWLMSLAGAAKPVSPSELIEAYQRAVRDTLACYERGP
ncbi:MAG TPA: WYL domain-containing protein [Gemmatimonadaceae bacterium]|nr:WYL domain-containing protein [Gemmatimonadaceae bacterium]